MKCAHAAHCGGCSMLQLSYSEQLSQKAAALRRLLGPHVDQTISFDPDVLFLLLPFSGDAARNSAAPSSPGGHAPSSTDQIHFRHKVSFVFGASRTGRGLIMGHYARGSNDIIPVDECPAHSARGNRIAFALRDALNRAGISPAGPRLAGLARHVIVRTTADDSQAVAMLVVTRNDKSLRRPVRAFLDSENRPDGFLVNINDEPGPYMVGGTTLKIDGHRSIRERMGGISFLVTPAAFFQTNPRAAERLQQYVVATLASRSRVLDLYCGCGLFSLPLAAAGARVLGIEESRSSIDDATENARLNRIAPDRIRFIASRAEDAVALCTRDRWDAVVLDPPRQGCSASVLRLVFDTLRPATVVYVSCNPEALAGEMVSIVRSGYRVRELHAVDMFPHTEHIEAVVHLTRV